MLEMRSVVPGQRPHRLTMFRNRPDFSIEPLRGRLSLDERWTEVVVAGLRPEASSALVGRRAADYLASELRGQLLARNVDLVVEDRMSRGRAQKVTTVRPPRFLGERVEGIGPVYVPAWPSIRFEIYVVGYSDDQEHTGLSVYSAGTLVADNCAALAPLGLDRPPWTDPRLTGLVDFPGFHVAPGSRRGVVVDEAASAFARALEPVEPVLVGVLEAIERRRTEELDRTLVRDLQRAFRDFYRYRPRYALLPVAEAGVGDTDAEAGVGEHVPIEAGNGQPEVESSMPVDLLPPGPLDSVRIRPTSMQVECLGNRRARAEALEVTGRPVAGVVEYQWSIAPALARLEPGGPSVLLPAGDEEGAAALTVVAASSGRTARARIEVEVLRELPAGRGSEGIPEPDLVHLPAANWRSRMEHNRWQVNTGHRDYRAVADRRLSAKSKKRR